MPRGVEMEEECEKRERWKRGKATFQREICADVKEQRKAGREGYMDGKKRV